MLFSISFFKNSGSLNRCELETRIIFPRFSPSWAAFAYSSMSFTDRSAVSLTTAKSRIMLAIFLYPSSSTHSSTGKRSQPLPNESNWKGNHDLGPTNEVNVDPGNSRTSVGKSGFFGRNTPEFGTASRASATDLLVSSPRSSSKRDSTTHSCVRYHCCRLIEAWTAAEISGSIAEKSLICCHSVISRRGAADASEACKKYGAWNKAIYCASRSTFSCSFGVITPCGRASANIESFNMYKQDAKKRAWCNAPGLRISNPCTGGLFLRGLITCPPR